VSYDIPQGDRRGVDIDHTDVTYDGLVDGYRLTGGLGQLTDGDFGSQNFRSVDSRGTGIKVRRLL
jgi:discoidin domain receptor family member 2